MVFLSPFPPHPHKSRHPELGAHPACARAVAASRVVWHLARNPRVAVHLMRCNLVPILFQGLAKPDLSDPLPLIGVPNAFALHPELSVSRL